MFVLRRQTRTSSLPNRRAKDFEAFPAVTARYRRTTKSCWEDFVTGWARRIVLAILLGALPATAAYPQSYPNQMVTVVVPYSAGSGADSLARHIADGLRQQMSVPVVVENRPGAAGALGTASVARAAADGYTILFAASPPFVTSTLTLDKPLYHPLTSFVPIGRVGTGPLVLITASKSPVTSFAALVAYARAHPDKANYASTGPGAPGHLYGELLNRIAGMELQQVAYRSSEQALVDVIAGNVLVSLASIAPAGPHIEGGALRALAIGTRDRMPDRPDLPTLAEVLGREGLEAGVWYGLLAPAGLPQDRLDRLSAEIRKVMSRPETKEFMARLGLVIEFEGSREFEAFLARDAEFAKTLVEGTVTRR